MTSLCETNLLNQFKNDIPIQIASYKQNVYSYSMMQNFSNFETQQLVTTGKSRRFLPDILKRAIMRLTQLDAATSIEDLRLPFSNKQEMLEGDRKEQ